MRRTVLIMLAAFACLGGSANAQEPAANTMAWDYDKVMTEVRSHLSHPERWDYKIVVYFTRTTIVEHTKKRTGTTRYFVVTHRRRDDALRLRWRRPPLTPLIAAADALDGY